METPPTPRCDPPSQARNQPAGPDASARPASSGGPAEFTCLFCGSDMSAGHCKLTCANCGYREDCSDLFRK